MSAIFKNSLFTVLAFTLVSGILLRLYLASSPLVPAWMPPPLCPCWDSNSYQCMAASFCHGTAIAEPTPTPYLQPIVTKPAEIKISDVSFTQDCQVHIKLSTNDTASFNLPNDRTISSTLCPTSTKYFISGDKKYAVFNNLSNPRSPGAALYSQALNKVVGIENWQVDSERITDAIFLSDAHLLLLFSNRIRSFDLNTLFSNYPGNMDFYQNKFKSISLESNTINLINLQDIPSTISLESNNVLVKRIDGAILESIELQKLYPRSSCLCWDLQNNFCLPQSSCLTSQ